MKLAIKSKIWSRLTLLVVLLALLAGPVRAVELGLTPSHVFEAWININATLIAVGAAATGDQHLVRRLEAMKPRRFQGKNPADVLKQLAIFRGKLDRLRSRHGLKATLVYQNPAGEKVTPSAVFLNTGHLLDSAVLLLIRLDGKRLIGGYFKRHDISGETPNGPYSLIDLANRRIDALLKR